MGITPESIKEKLNIAITEAVEQRQTENDDEKAFSRNRILTMETMLKTLFSMKGGSLNKELHELGINVSASAFSQQRKKLSFWDLENVFENFNKQCFDEKKYKGYRLLAIDGTVVNMPRNPKSESYVCHKSAPQGYNQLHVNPLYDILNNTYLHCVIQAQPSQDEVGALLFMLHWYDFKEKTLIIADRGYESYNVFATFIEKNVDFLIRVKQERTAMREVAKLPMEELDTDINFTITITQTNVDKANGYIYIQTHRNKNRVYSKNTNSGRFDFPTPYPMKLRIVRFQLDNGTYETLATSLPRSFTIEEIKELYHWRWKIETSFRNLKYGLGLIYLHGKSDDFVKQEVFSSMIMANFCSRITALATLPKKTNSGYSYAVNYNMAIHLCREFYRDKSGNGKKLLQNIRKYTEPIRLGRKDERNLKSKAFVGSVYRVSS